MFHKYNFDLWDLITSISKKKYIATGRGFPDSLVGKESTCNAGGAMQPCQILWIIWKKHSQAQEVDVDLNQRFGNAFQFSSVAQMCPTLCDPMDCSPLDSSVPGILQTRILEWVAMPFPRGSSPPRDWTHISHISCIVPLCPLCLYAMSTMDVCLCPRAPPGKPVILQPWVFEREGIWK